MNQDSKAISRIFRKYFDIVDEYFGGIKHHLGGKEDSHIELGKKIANYPLISDLVLDSIEDVGSEIYKFWMENLDDVVKFLEEQEKLKCLYSGEVAPSILENFVKRAALYIDTIVLSDPLFYLSVIQEQITKDKKYYLYKLIRHVFNIWKLRELVLADTDDKIIIMLPSNLQMVNDSDQKKLKAIADHKFTSYVNQVFNRDLKDKGSCLDFMTSFKQAKDIYSHINDFTILPRIFRNQDSFESFMADYGSTGKHTYIDQESMGLYLGMFLYSEFARVQEHKFFCKRLTAEPVYDNDLSYFYFNYEIGGLDMDGAIANALQKEDFRWITNVPISMLKKLREKNFLNYMRDIMRHGITDLKAKNDEDLMKVSLQVQKNFEEAFKRQKLDVNTLKIRRSEVEEEMPITIGLSLLGKIPILEYVISIFQVGRDIKRLNKEHREVTSTIQKYENNFVSILIKAHERK